MDGQKAQGPVNVAAAVGAVQQNPSESSIVNHEAEERERAAQSVEALAESSAERGITETHIDQPSSGTTSPDSLGSGPPD